MQVGSVLTCERFEDGLPATGTIREVSPDGQSALLWIERLGRIWPIRVELVDGNMWTHAPGDYPPLGADDEFDAKYRSALRTGEQIAASVHKATDRAASTGAIDMRRQTRPGHAWARTVGRGPTRLISPRRTFSRLGSSSSEKRRSSAPTRVMRGSLGN